MKKAPEKAEAAPAAGPIKIKIGGEEREFDIDNPVLADWIEENKLTAGGYPYDKKMKSEDYGKELERLQIELVKAQAWLQATGKRVMALCEVRDAAGICVTILVLWLYMNQLSSRN